MSQPNPRNDDISDVRLRIYEAAWELVREVGISDGTATISLDDIVGRAEVPRSTAYRHFTVEDRTPREEFRRCFGEWVRLELQDLHSTDAATMEVAARQLATPVPDSPVERRKLLTEMLMEIMAVNQQAVERDDIVAASIALRAASWSRAVAADEVDSWTPVVRPDNQKYQDLTKAYMEHFRAVPRAGMDVELFGELVAAWVTGIILTIGLDRTVELQPRSEDKPVPLGLSALAIVALIETFVDFEE